MICTRSKEEKDVIEKIMEIVNNVQGWLSDAEGLFLYKTAKNVSGKGVIVEIGSWKGKSTIWLAKGSKDGNKVKICAIDPHTGRPGHHKMYEDAWTFPEFKTNIKNVGVIDVVLPIVKTSQDAAEDWNKPVEFIFIDGAHDYGSVKKDFELWYPHVVYGGIMAFHDTTDWEGPKRLVKDAIYKSRNFKDLGLVDSITYATKVKQTSVKDILKNRYLPYLRNLEELLGKLPADSIVKHIIKRCMLLKRKRSQSEEPCERNLSWQKCN